jgi:hypothetical protein
MVRNTLIGLLTIILIWAIVITLTLEANDISLKQGINRCVTRESFLTTFVKKTNNNLFSTLKLLENENYYFEENDCITNANQKLLLSEITTILNLKPFVLNTKYIKINHSQKNILITLAEDDSNIAGTNSLINGTFIVTLNPKHYSFKNREFLFTTLLNELFETGRPEVIRYS